MKGVLKVNEDTIGEIDFKIIDESMGAIGGPLVVYSAYEKYKAQFQFLYGQNGNENSDDFSFTIVLEGEVTIRPAGGISVTDSPEFAEKYVDAAGIDFDIIENIKLHE